MAKEVDTHHHYSAIVLYYSAYVIYIVNSIIANDYTRLAL